MLTGGAGTLPKKTSSRGATFSIAVVIALGAKVVFNVGAIKTISRRSSPTSFSAFTSSAETFSKGAGSGRATLAVAVVAAFGSKVILDVFAVQIVRYLHLDWSSVYLLAGRTFALSKDASALGTAISVAKMIAHGAEAVLDALAFCRF